MAARLTRNHQPLRTANLLTCAAFALVLLAGCGRNADKRDAEKKPPEAGYVVLQKQTVPLSLTLPGRTTAFESSEVRPQVSGIIRARLFTEGAKANQGDLLY